MRLFFFWCYHLVVFTSNWAKISKKVIARAEEVERPSKKADTEPVETDMNQKSEDYVV